MSEEDGPQQQRYCTNCGAEIRPGTKFCVSCGAVLSSADASRSTNDTPPFEDAHEEELLNEAGPHPDEEGVSGKAITGDIPGNIINWFRDLPSVPKMIILGLVLLLLLTILSPLALVVAALVLGVSVIALIVRLAQRRSIRGWGIAAVTSLASLFILGGISDAIYGTGFWGGNGSGGSGGASLAPSASEDHYADVPQVSPSDYDEISRMGPVLEGTPYYEVYDTLSAGSEGATMIIQSEIRFETCRSDMQLLMEDIGAQTRRFEYVTFSVYNLGPLPDPEFGHVWDDGDVFFGTAGFGKAGTSGSEPAVGQPDSLPEYVDQYREGKYEYYFNGIYCA